MARDASELVLAGARTPVELGRLNAALPDYEIGEELGRGAFGIVMAGRHRRLGREVAVKLLASGYGVDPEIAARFLAEARVLAALDHPHVVPVYDYVDADGLCLLIMERLTGGTVKERLAAGELSPRAACAVLAAACSGLHYAHRMGVLHRDVKPQNLLLSADRVVKVADFGIAKVMAGSTGVATQTGLVLGTPSYMAPEQVQGSGMSASVDVYAAGIVFYELLCGELPFPAADDPLAALYQRVHGQPIPLLERAPGLPQALAAIADRALRRDPDDRYATAGELGDAIARAAADEWGPEWIEDTRLPADVEARALTAGSTVAAAHAPSRRDEAPPARPLPAPLAISRTTSFVGRHGDLDRLHRAWERVRADGLQVAMIGGEPGIGKTRLASEFARAAHAQRAEVLFGRCDEELAIPYQPIAEMLRTYIAAAPGEAAIDAELAPLVPQLGVGQVGSAAKVDPAARRYQLFEAVASFLTKLTAARPVVLVLDDLHWADLPTMQLLRYLALSPTRPALLIVGTYRDTERSRSRVIEQMLADLDREGLVERIPLRGLTESDFEAMVASAGVHHARLDLVRALHIQTEGNPFFAREALRHLAETGVITEHGSWVGAGSLERMAIPEGVKATIRGRLARLPAPTDEILAHAAVLGRIWEYEILDAMEPAGAQVLLECVEAALGAKLIVEFESERWPRYAFTHALVRETLYEELSLPRRQRLHVKAAQAIERVYGTRLDPHAATLATHYRLAGSAAEPAAALRWSLRAGELAAAQFAWEEAVAHWDHAVELMSRIGVEPEHRARLLERLGDLKYAASFDTAGGTVQLEEALQCYESAGDRSRAARTRSRIARNLATYWGPRQDVRRAREYLEAAEPVLREEGDGVPLASVYTGLATAAIWANDVPEILRASKQAMGIAERIGNDALWANAAALSGQGLWTAGRIDEGRRLFSKAWEIADRLNHPWVAFLATWCAQGAAGWLGEPAEVMRWCERELAKPRITQAAGQRELLDGFRGWGAVFSGDLDDARSAVERSPLEHYPFAVSMLELMGGDAKNAAAIMAASMADADQRGNTWNEMCMGFRRGQAQWLLRDAAMEATYRAAIALATRGGAAAFELIIRSALVPRLVEMGRLEDARAELTRSQELFESGGSWSARAGDIALARATLAAAEGRGSEADYDFAAAIAAFSGFGVVWDEAEAWYRWGVALATRDRIASNEKLDAALDIYVRHGASQLWRDLVATAREAP